MALYYITCLQYFSLHAFDATNDLAYHLHRTHTRFAGAEDIYWAVTLNAPTFRLSRLSPLTHDGLSGTAVLHALQERLAPGKRIRFVEVGVFRANLSSHVWRRVGFAQGHLEMHLVDHWGEGQPAGDIPTSGVGTGSNMGGASNSSLFNSVVHGFSRAAARCIQVPYWMSDEQIVRATVASGGDVFFHRTSSVAAASAFEDESLDVVYIDADHKWWSVVQDLAAWWPKIRPGGALLGHDFHLNSLMEREDQPGGDSNDVPMAVLSFFRAPLEITLHTGFVWSVEKPLRQDAGSNLDFKLLCAFLRERMKPHMQFEICYV
eukprot:gnl/MRDRNA2_/MRDRNA2_21638_c0_seq1.p1 gnl/MRDRNA2_/MRDRNA2_21638_c0~~gnl/MRDRNA2_/MRDRNA2_21638_c0_seq1.p1  ORF type:complete len:351 (+),score=51.50 gnl/MRDRNA2_/MRDRNA2_21638_c0_seq1:98-1054(+)